jgi:hypothetical protein
LLFRGVYGGLLDLRYVFSGSVRLSVLGSTIYSARRDSHASRFHCIVFCPAMEPFDGAYRILFVLDMDSLGFITEIMSMKIDQWPNKSPEPTPVGAVSSASRFTVFGPAWLSFFR